MPEPGTWATMLLGFGLIGWRVRRGAGRTAKLLPA
ncbi:MAG: PEPxxWA-CTERM sorting domain-containing protein [Sphingomicrobium sp.]